MIALLLAPLLLATPTGATSTIQDVALVSFQGLPSDPLERDDILAAFRSTFAQSVLDTESERDDQWAPGAALENGFRLVDGEPARGTWSMSLVVTQPPVAPGGTHMELVYVGSHAVWREVRNRGKGRRLTRGVGLTITILTPQQTAVGADGEPWHIGVAFPAPPDPAVSGKPAARPGHEVPWSEAGHTIALLALEELHRRNGALGEARRLDLGDWSRMRSVR
jgi:hypothetical protein